MSKTKLSNEQIEDFIYKKTRRFITYDVIDAVQELIENQIRDFSRDANISMLKARPIGWVLIGENGKIQAWTDIEDDATNYVDIGIPMQPIYIRDHV